MNFEDERSLGPETEADTALPAEQTDAWGSAALSPIAKFYDCESPEVKRKEWKSSATIAPESPPVSKAVPKKTSSAVAVSASNANGRYYMNHGNRGVAIIINNNSFSKSMELPSRPGTDIDAAALEATFATLGFDKPNIHTFNDLSCSEMQDAMKYFATENYDGMDCFICAILTHGKENVLFGYDGKISLETLIEPFKRNNNPSLARKPKLFFIQACRGTKFDDGFDVEDDQDLVEADAPFQRLSLEADFLYAFSTVSGYFSWRNSARGSWFVQTFAKIVKENAEKLGELDLLRILTRVNHGVAYGFASNTPATQHMHQKKQMPSIVSMLTKELYFK